MHSASSHLHPDTYAFALTLILLIPSTLAFSFGSGDSEGREFSRSNLDTNIGFLIFSLPLTHGENEEKTHLARFSGFGKWLGNTTIGESRRN
jgi:hypothetical protein